MGIQLIEFYNKKISKSDKTAFVATFIIGLLTHIYKFTNNFPNHDSLYNYYTDQNVVGSGRWFLSVACGLSSWFDLPWVNGLFSVFYIALTAVIIVNVFKITNLAQIVIGGGLARYIPCSYRHIGIWIYS